MIRDGPSSQIRHAHAPRLP